MKITNTDRRILAYLSKWYVPAGNLQKHLNAWTPLDMERCPKCSEIVVPHLVRHCKSRMHVWGKFTQSQEYVYDRIRISSLIFPDIIRVLTSMIPFNKAPLYVNHPFYCVREAAKEILRRVAAPK